MIRIFGSLGCTRCEMVKKELKKKGLIFEYILLSDLDEGKREEIFKTSQENGISQLPVIIENGEFLTIVETLNK